MISPATLLILVIIAITSGLNAHSLGSTAQMLIDSLGAGHSQRHSYRRTAMAILISSLLLGLVGSLTYMVLKLLPDFLTETAGIIYGLVAAAAGLAFVRHYFFPLASGLQRHYRRASRLQHLAARPLQLSTTVRLGGLHHRHQLRPVGLLMLGALFIIRFQELPLRSVWLLAAGSSVVPLLALGAVVYHIRLSALVKWKEQHKHMMYLFSGLTLVALGWLVIMMSGGMIGL